jgi:hypothetical protein
MSKTKDSHSELLWFILFIFIMIIIYKVYRYQEEMEQKDYLIQEIERFQNQIRYLKENPEVKYQLKDEDIFEIMTDYERFSQQHF